MERELEREKVVLLEHDCPLDVPTCHALEAAGYGLQHVLTDNEAEIAEACRDASAVLTFMTSVRETVIARMERCKIIVRLGVAQEQYVAKLDSIIAIILC